MAENRHLNSFSLHLIPQNISPTQGDTHRASNLCDETARLREVRLAWPLRRASSPKGRLMEILATLKNGNAVLKLVTNSSNAEFVINDATKLARDLENLMNNPTANAIDRHYRIAPSDTGVCVETNKGKFDLPWRHIMPVVNDLRA